MKEILCDKCNNLYIPHDYSIADRRTPVYGYDGELIEEYLTKEKISYCPLCHARNVFDGVSVPVYNATGGE